MLPFVAVQTTLIAYSAAAVIAGVTVEQFAVEAVGRKLRCGSCDVEPV